MQKHLTDLVIFGIIFRTIGLEDMWRAGRHLKKCSDCNDRYVEAYLEFDGTKPVAKAERS